MSKRGERNIATGVSTTYLANGKRYFLIAVFGCREPAELLTRSLPIPESGESCQRPAE